MLPGPAAPTLLNIGLYQAPACDAVRPHRIPEGNELVELLTAGLVRHEVDGREVRFGQGTLFWHVAGEDTVHKTSPAEPYACLVVRWAVAPGAPRPVPRVSVLAEPERANALSREFLRAFHDAAVDRGRISTYVREILCWESYRGGLVRPEAPPPAALSAAGAAIEKGFSRPGLSVADLAASAGLSGPHLYALFRRHQGQTPHQALLARRVREACLLLAGSDRPIKVVAADCGFANVETFYRVFRRQAGLAPGAYRDRHRVDPFSSAPGRDGRKA